MSAVLTVERITDIDTLALVEPEWWTLWQRSQTATPFQSPAWQLAWWAAFSPGQLRVLAIRNEDELAALVPLYLETGTLGPRLLPIGISLSDYIDVLTRPEAAGVLDEVVGQLCRWSEWDCWEMEPVPFGAALLRIPSPEYCTRHVTESETCPVLDLHQGYTDAGTHAAVPARQRRKLRMARHRIARSGARIALVTTTEWSSGLWIEALFKLHALRWQERGEPGVLADPRTRTFQDAALPCLMRRGIARLLALTIDGELAAVYYGFTHRHRAYAYLGGFDPRFSYYSPGTLLLGRAIEDALREGVREFHFLRGAEDYKYAWGATDRQTFRVAFKKRSAHD